jgi:hypothetical protein
MESPRAPFLLGNRVGRDVSSCTKTRPGRAQSVCASRPSVDVQAHCSKGVTCGACTLRAEQCPSAGGQHVKRGFATPSSPRGRHGVMVRGHGSRQAALRVITAMRATTWQQRLFRRSDCTLLTSSKGVARTAPELPRGRRERRCHTATIAARSGRVGFQGRDEAEKARRLCTHAGVNGFLQCCCFCGVRCPASR